VFEKKEKKKRGEGDISLTIKKEGNCLSLGEAEAEICQKIMDPLKEEDKGEEGVETKRLTVEGVLKLWKGMGDVWERKIIAEGDASHKTQSCSVCVVKTRANRMNTGQDWDRLSKMIRAS